MKFNLTKLSMLAITVISVSGACEAFAQNQTRAAEEPVRIGDPAGLQFASTVYPATAVNGKLYFQGIDDSHGEEPWVSDGTAEGTYMLGDLEPGSLGSAPGSFTEMDGLVYFRAGNDSTGPDATTASLWVTDGTPANTTRLADIPGHWNIAQFRPANGILYFYGLFGEPISVWRSDGTSTGTFKLKTPPNFVIDRAIMAATGDGVVFFGEDVDSGLGNELWRAENTSDTVSLVKDINPGTADSVFSSYPAVTMNGKALFLAETEEFGAELWTSDGTDQGTTLVKDLTPGRSRTSAWLTTQIPYELEVEAPLYFTNTGRTPGFAVTDGTAAGTMQLADFSGTITTHSLDMGFVNGRIVFNGHSSDLGSEIWVSDGTDSGSGLLKDINPGAPSSFPHSIKVAGNYCYFFASDPQFGTELWRTDGTPEGTQIVKDIYPGSASSTPRDLQVVGKYIYFTADDGVHGRELWMSGGSSVTTRMVKDLEPGAVGSHPNGVEVVGNTVVFEATSGGVTDLYAVSAPKAPAAAQDWQLFN